MKNYCIYVRGNNNNLWWVKTFYANCYKSERGAYKAANRYANQLHEKTGNTYIVVDEEL